MRKGNAIGKKMPLDIEGWLSDPDIQAWYDDQEKWYLRLLINAWKHTENPCHLPNEPERLMVLAGVPTWHPDRVRAWKERGPAVLRKFVKTDDGKWLFNLKQVETYAEQLAKWDARRDAGSKGGKARAEAIVAKRSNATNLLDHSSSRASHSLSNSTYQSESKKQEETKPVIRGDDLVSKIMAIGFRDSTRRSKSLIEHAVFEEIQSGVDGQELCEKLRMIHVWTDSGQFAPKCYEVIPRWREPQNLWERRNGSVKQKPAEAEVGKWDGKIGESSEIDAMRAAGELTACPKCGADVGPTWSKCYGCGARGPFATIPGGASRAVADEAQRPQKPH